LIARMFLAWRVIGRTFGRWIPPLFVGAYLLNLWWVNTVGLALDRLFFPDLRRARVKAPIVIVGNPRTGTTFLQQFLTDHRIGHGVQVWRMIFSSLTVQALVKPFLPLLMKLDPTRYHNSAAHKTSLVHVETDDVLFLPRFFDGFFLYGFFLSFAEEEYKDLFDPDKRDTTARDFAWLEAVWTRSLVHAKDPEGRVVAKLFSLSARLPRFLERFPDAKVLFMARDPLSIIPSGMSLITGVLDNLFGFWTLPEEVRRRFLERLYRGFVELMQRFEADMAAGKLPPERVFVVRYDRMMADFEGLMGDMLAFLDHPPDDALRAVIAARDAKQKAYKSGHSYDLARFGLSEERIRADLAGFYRAFID
jgi:omega-hydroxy-beta-dihydromenaquinone-9 sulfotransferase